MQAYFESNSNTVHHLGKQDIPFRGHQEQIKPKNSNSNPENFIALLKLQAVNDSVHHQHFYVLIIQNTTYLSAKSQNEVTDIIGK